MECLYADTSKVPRYLMTKGGELRQMCAEDRLDLKRPNQGSFTVESDRHFMRNLEATAQTISSQMERGFETVKHCGSPAKAGSTSPLKGGMSPLKVSKYAASLRSHANMADLLS